MGGRHYQSDNLSVILLVILMACLYKYCGICAVCISNIDVKSTRKSAEKKGGPEYVIQVSKTDVAVQIILASMLFLKKRSYKYSFHLNFIHLAC